MIVDDLNIFRSILQPTKTDTKLVVYPNTELADSVAFERLQTIPRWNPEVVKTLGNLQLAKLSSRHRFNRRKSPNPVSVGEDFSISALE